MSTAITDLSPNSGVLPLDTALLEVPGPDAGIFARVQECFVEALGVEPEEVTMDAKVIDDLGAESLDFLDIAYRLEQSFKVKIPRGDIKKKSQEGLEEEQWEVDGVLTPVALTKLRDAMPEVDPAEIQAGLAAKDIPRLFTVETFYNIVVQLMNGG